MNKTSKKEPAKEAKGKYQSPRWSAEYMECELPITLDTYSRCSFNCQYCFSYFQRQRGDPATQTPSAVNKEQTKSLFRGVAKSKRLKQFEPAFKRKKAIQWGGLGDALDKYEKRFGITKEILKTCRELKYPISFSTKAVWWLYDDDYRELFRDMDCWHLKVSIINYDKERAKKIEGGVKSPVERVKGMREYKKINPDAPLTLRLRPFILGFTDKNDEHIKLIKEAHEAGADSVSTEFLCVDSRSGERVKGRINKISEVVGFDVFDYYKRYSDKQGYRRLNYEIKKPYMEEMKALCDELGMRFYVSDCDHGEKNNNGCCCGLPESWNYFEDQITVGILIAKEKGEVHFSDIDGEDMELLANGWWADTNVGNTVNRAKMGELTLRQVVRNFWNQPQRQKSPYKYFSGVLEPKDKLDDNGDVVYKYMGK